LSDELDLTPTALSDSPQWLANASIGNTTYAGTTYEFRYVRNSAGDIVGAMVKPSNSTRAYSKDKDGRLIRNPNRQPDAGKEFFVNKAQLNKMLTQDAPTPPPAAPDGGMMAMAPDDGVPPMPEGM